MGNAEKQPESPGRRKFVGSSFIALFLGISTPNIVHGLTSLGSAIPETTTKPDENNESLLFDEEYGCNFSDTTSSVEQMIKQSIDSPLTAISEIFNQHTIIRPETSNIDQLTPKVNVYFKPQYLEPNPKFFGNYLHDISFMWLNTNPHTPLVADINMKRGRTYWAQGITTGRRYEIMYDGTRIGGVVKYPNGPTRIITTSNLMKYNSFGSWFEGVPWSRRLLEQSYVGGRVGNQ